MQMFDMLQSLGQNSHSPQASAWGYGRNPMLGNRFNGLRVLGQSSSTPKVNSTFLFIRTMGKPLKRFLNLLRAP